MRDKIPDIIKSKGETPVTHIADDDKYWKELKRKLHEEVDEFCNDENDEEMADIIEVLYALMEHRGTTIESIEELKNCGSLTMKGAAAFGNISFLIL